MDIDKFSTVDELEARQAELEGRVAELDKEYGTRSIKGTEAEAEWNAANEEIDAIRERVDELKARQSRLSDLASRQATPKEDRMGAPTVVIKKEHLQGEAIYDLAGYRRAASSEEEERRMLRDGAMKAIETGRYGEGDVAEMQASAERVLRTAYDPFGVLARQIIETGNPAHERAFFKSVRNPQHPRLTPEEERAMTTGTEGDILLPFALDPTIILTSNGVVNPIRAIARTVSIVGTNTWKGVTGHEGTAAYASEAAQASDNSTALAQPVVEAIRAQYFVPFSIELDQDWGALRTELGRLVAESKDVLESDKFLTGAGSTEPEGLLTGVTAVATSSATATLTVADVYGLKDDVAPRFQARGRFVANGTTYSKIRQLDTSGGASLWVQLAAGDPDRLIGYPAHVWSDMAAPASGATIMAFGDFSKYLIVDRVGMGAEIVPHLFGTANNYPTGQRGFYALWRNSGTVLVPGAFELLEAL